MGAALLIAGLKQENSAGRSAQLLGCALLGAYSLLSVHHDGRKGWAVTCICSTN